MPTKWRALTCWHRLRTSTRRPSSSSLQMHLSRPLTAAVVAACSVSPTQADRKKICTLRTDFFFGRHIHVHVCVNTSMHATWSALRFTANSVTSPDFRPTLYFQCYSVVFAPRLYFTCSNSPQLASFRLTECSVICCSHCELSRSLAVHFKWNEISWHELRFVI